MHQSLRKLILYPLNLSRHGVRTFSMINNKNNLHSSSLTFQSRCNIYVETQKTPNPNFLKFIPEGHNVLGSEGTLDISEAKFAEVSPLAKKLFEISGIVRVFYGSDYLSIAK